MEQNKNILTKSEADGNCVIHDARPGIQPGQIAQSQESKTLHTNISEICRTVLSELNLCYPQLAWKSGLTGNEISHLLQVPLLEHEILTGCQPDGGIFLSQDYAGNQVPLVAFEAKNQGNIGNAIERWFKNYTALKGFGHRFCFVTFCTGDGSAPNGIMTRILNNALVSYGRESQSKRMRCWNRLYTSGPSFYRRVQGFSPLVLEIIVRAAVLNALKDVSRR